MGTSKHPNKKQTFLGLFFIDVSNEPKSVLTRELEKLAERVSLVENINNRLRYKAHY